MTFVPNSNEPRVAFFYTATGLVFVSMITVWVYWPGLQGGYLFDDYPNVVNNPKLAPTKLTLQTVVDAAFSIRSGVLYRPISYLSFLVNNVYLGATPFAMKSVNLGIHLINGLLLYLLLKLILDVWGDNLREKTNALPIRFTALAVTSAWLLLPINLTGVLYVVQRMTSLSAAFTFLALIFFLKGRLNQLKGQRGWPNFLFGSGVCFILSVLSKETGVLIPLYALTLELTLLGFRTNADKADNRLIFLYAVVLLAPGTFGLYWALENGWLTAARNFTVSERLFTEARVVLDYIRWSLLPALRSLSFFHDDYPISRGILDPPTTVAAILAVFALISVALLKRRQYPLVALGIMWFFAGQLLESTVFPLELVHEHRNYVPSVGLLLTLFSILLLIPVRRALQNAGKIAAIGIVILYGTVTTFRAQLWSDPIKLATFTVETHPNSMRAAYEQARLFTNLATDKPESKFTPLAYAALERASAMRGHSLLPESALIILSAKHGNPIKRQWFQSMQQRLYSTPMSAEDSTALFALVRCMITDRACQLPKTQIDALFDAAFNSPSPLDKDELVAAYASYQEYVRLDLDKAYDLLLTAIRLAPEKPKHRATLAKFYIRTENFTDARKTINELHKMNRFGVLGNLFGSLEMLLQQRDRPRKLPYHSYSQPTLDD